MENVCIEDNDATETYYRMDMNPTEKKVTKVYEKWYLIQHYKCSLNNCLIHIPIKAPEAILWVKPGSPRKVLKQNISTTKAVWPKMVLLWNIGISLKYFFLLQLTTKNLVVAFALLLVVVGATSMIAFLLKVQDEEKGNYSNIATCHRSVTMLPWTCRNLQLQKLTLIFHWTSFGKK